MTESIIFLFQPDKGELFLKFPKQFRTIHWNTEFGNVEKIIAEKKQYLTHFTIDLSETQWIDPLPIMSILLLFKEFEDQAKFSLIVNTLEDEKDIEDTERRVLSFFHFGGIIEVLKSLNVDLLNNHGDKIDLDKLELANLKKNLLFQDGFICIPQILDLNKFSNSEEITQWVRGFIKNNLHRIKQKIPTKHHKTILNTLFLFLSETLLNSYEHAYINESKKLAALFIRYRYGTTNGTIGADYRKILEKAFHTEHTNTPRLNLTFGDMNPAFIECFIYDKGVGITKSYLAEEVEKTHYPFRDILDLIINEGRRNLKTKKSTQFGGLYILSRLITKGFLWIKDKNEFFGEPLPIKAKLGQTEIKEGASISGLPIIARIGWKENVTKNTEWLNAYDIDLNDINDHPLVISCKQQKDIYQYYLSNKYKTFTANPFHIVDDRLAELPVEEIFVKNYLKNPNSKNFILYLPSEELTKHEIFKKISEGFSSILNPSKTIIIAEIHDDEAGLYQYALNSATFSDSFKSKFDTIILITKNLSVLFLEKNISTNLYTPNKVSAKDYYLNNRIEFAPHKSLTHLLQWLKTHDSIFYWRYVFKKLTYEDFFIKGEIEWPHGNQESILDTYFNFGNTLSNKICQFFYNSYLEKAHSLFNNNVSNFTAADPLVKNIIETYNAKHSNSLNENPNSILINSVFVTGSTINNKSILKEHISISYFKNTSFNKKEVPNNQNTLSFLLWPDENLLNLKLESTTKKLKRIGCSPFVAPFGWKYYTLPRFYHVQYPKLPIYDVVEKLSEIDQEIIDTDFKSISVRNPKNSYEDWQSKNIVGIGHYEYGGYHDLYKIDIPFAIDESVTLNGQLICFLISELCFLFEIHPDELNLESIFKNKIKTVSKNSGYLTDDNIFKFAKEKADFLVYPFHYATEHIIRTLSSVFPETLREKFISLMPLQTSSTNTPIFISPQVINRIRNITKEANFSSPTKKVKVILFDTSRINGKTEREITHILNLCGADSIITITLLDRQRLPIHLFEAIENKIYWKFDIPILGSKNNCIICKSLDRLKFLKNILTNDFLAQRIDAINLNWKSVFRYSGENENHGIRPVELSLSKNGKKKFGVYVEKNITKQIGGDDNQILIQDSHGLSIYLNEILSMTTRDDLILDVLMEESLPLEAVIECTCTLLLLYHNQISNGTKKQLLENLFSITKRETEVSNHTAIALITLLINSEVLLPSIETYVYEPSSRIFNVENRDILIFLCEMAASVSESNIKQIAPVRRLIKSYDNEALLIKELHYDLYNDYGTAHDTPLHKIKKGEILTKALFHDAYSSIKKIRHLIDRFEISSFLSNSGSEYITDDLQEIDAYIESLHLVLSEVDSYNKKEFNEEIQSISSRSLSEFRYLLDKFDLIHSQLFLPLNISTPNTFILKDRILNLFADGNPETVGLSKEFKKPIVQSTNIKEKWIPWNARIESLIKDTVDNCKYTEFAINDPANTENISKNKVWISTNYDAGYFDIQFTNRTKDAASYSIEAARVEKKKPNEMYLKSIGGEMASKDLLIENNPHIVVTIRLPFI